MWHYKHAGGLWYLYPMASAWGPELCVCTVAYNWRGPASALMGGPRQCLDSNRPMLAAARQAPGSRVHTRLVGWPLHTLPASCPTDATPPPALPSRCGVWAHPGARPAAAPAHGPHQQRASGHCAGEAVLGCPPGGLLAGCAQRLSPAKPGNAPVDIVRVRRMRLRRGTND